MQYPTTTDSGNLYPTPPPDPFPVAVNYGDYIFYDGTDWVVGDTKIKLGGFAGQTNQGNNATALGYFAGTTNQGEQALALGYNAANSGQGNYAAAVGTGAGQYSQGTNSVAVGYNAGNIGQGGSSIAIGAFAGYGNQEPNTIILNANGGILNGVAAQPNSFYVAPVRDYGNANTFSPLGYNPTTREIGYATPRCGIHTCVVGTTQVITIPGLTADGIVGLTYIHPPGGGAGQFFHSSTPTTDTLTIELGQTATTAESIIWIVGKL
jgi:hypothetical protein